MQSDFLNIFRCHWVLSISHFMPMRVHILELGSCSKLIGSCKNAANSRLAFVSLMSSHKLHISWEEDRPTSPDTLMIPMTCGWKVNVIPDECTRTHFSTPNCYKSANERFSDCCSSKPQEVFRSAHDVRDGLSHFMLTVRAVGP